jgi:hypothetical protein
MKALWTGVALALVLSLSPVVLAGTATPVVDQRQENQDERIDQGVASGELTAHEIRQLDRQQDRIENREERFESDGVVTAGERARLQRQENRASRNIYRKKHNARDRD